MTQSNTAKLFEICNALLTGTREGRLVWQETEDPDAFEINFPDYSIRVALRKNRARLGLTPYVLQVYNDQGRLIETAAGDGMAAMSHVLEELYELVKRQALGIDKALDDLLSRLSA